MVIKRSFKSGVTSYEYDTLSRLITAISPLTGTVIYDYDLVGNRISLMYPGGKVVTTTYNADGQEVTVTDWDGGVTTYTYDAAGRLSATTLPNGVQTTNNYDAAGRLTGLSHVDMSSGALQAEYLYELDKRGNNRVVTETMRLPDGSGLEQQIIAYDYDPLYRTTEAAYSGVLSGTYAYEYNAVGSRIYFSTNITNTETVTYTYDAASQLQESLDLVTGDLTVYEWDDAGRMITTTVAGVVNKVYQYSQDGDLIRAEVDGLVTTFAYDGHGSRLQMSVAGETTTYLPDYGGRRNRILFEQGTEETKQYLYGAACLGEFVTDNATSDTEWRYYQRDGNSLVRQTTNQTATITLAWTFSPEGGVLLGEEGSVTHLGCGDDAVYDWSTGLIFKSGRYFDPSLGIWLTMGGAVIWHNAIPGSRRKRKRQDKKRRWVLILLLLLIVLTLTACGPTPTPEPAETATCTPTPLSSTRLPIPISNSYDNQIKDSTVVIQIGESTSENSFSGTPSLATVINSGNTLITHNHFDPAEEASATEVLIRKPQQVLWEIFSKSDIQNGTSLINAQTRRIQLPHTLPGIPSARLGNPSDLIVGDGVSIAYYDDPIDDINVYHAIVKAIAIPSNPDSLMSDSVLSAFFEDSTPSVINKGDSGGGMFLNGKLIGSHWLSEISTDEAVSALLLP